MARELSKLVEAGLLTRSPQGNQVLYAANTASPVFEKLASILRRTAGLADVLAQALAPLAARVRAALSGSGASDKARPGSDADMLLIGGSGRTLPERRTGRWIPACRLVAPCRNQEATRQVFRARSRGGAPRPVSSHVP